MSLSEQERHCIECACEFLSSTIGGRWGVEKRLDELYPTEPTPEVVVTNGEANAAIEVKEMVGGSTYQLASAYLSLVVDTENGIKQLYAWLGKHPDVCFVVPFSPH